MRNFKKILSLVLCMAMMLSVMVVGAGAAFKDQSKIKNTEAVDVCAALNIINGYTDGSYRPEGTITRAEACKMICVALNGGKDPVLGTNATPTFTDIKGHWAEKYIEYCVSEGIVAGVGGGKFNPNGNVTGSQFAKMLLIALGFNAQHAQFLGNAWEVNVNVKASEKGLYEDLESMDPTAALTRDNAAQMVYNALDAETVDYDFTLVTDENGNLTSRVDVKDSGVLAGKDWLGLLKHEGTLTAAGKLAIDQAIAADDYIIVDDNDEDTKDNFKTDDVDYTDLIGQNVEVLYKVVSGKVVVYGVYATSDNTIVEGSTANMKSFEGTTSMKLDGKTVKFDGVDVYAKNVSGNNNAYTALSVDQLKSLFSEKYNFAVKAIDNDDDGKVEVVLVETYVVGQVKSATSSAFTVSAYDLDKAGTIFAADVQYQNKASIKYDYDDADITNPTVYTGMAREDYVVVTKDAMTGAPVVEEAAVVTGKIAAIQGDDLKIGDAWYANVDTTTAVKAGDEANFYMADDVIFFIGDVDSSADVNDYVLVTGVDQSYGDYQIRVLKADGKVAYLEPYTTAPASDEDYEWETTVAIGDSTDGGIHKDAVYRIEAKGDQYKFYAVTEEIATDMDDFNDFAPIDAKGDFVYNKDNNAKTTLVGDRIAADAVIFACVDGTYKVITGAELQGMNINKESASWVLTPGAIAVSKDADSGLSYVQLAYIGNLGKTVAGADTSKYAYVVAEQGTMTNADGDIVSTITIANGTDDPIVLEGDALKADVAPKGYLIKYDVNSDGTVDMETVTKLLGQDDLEKDKLCRIAITGVDGKDIVADKNDILTMDEDTVILYVNLDDKEGADEFAIPTADKDAKGDYIDNAYVIYEKDGNDNIVKLLVLDSDNDLKN